MISMDMGMGGLKNELPLISQAISLKGSAIFFAKVLKTTYSLFSQT